ncbi:uncharacterized protein TNIN_188551 [Trichonephila inaurata madagascariensis]|uniref:Gustatory receptor n=1 Tax=Trichonephila inaurata madagascariensis TaxID=2747483 RepID=A0A8X6K3X8_9ARAC|nr:uncharacterized protein TNIN_188551 [Trichonephila inaurata madagascariensis]
MIFDLSAKEQVWGDKAFEKVVFPHDREQTPKNMTAMPKKLAIWFELNIVIKLLKVTGIDLASCDYNHSRLNKLFPKLCTVAGIFAFILSFSFIASEVLFCGVTRFVSSSVVICMGSTLCMSLLLWIVMLKRRKQFALLIDRSGTIHDSFRVSTNLKPRRWIRLCGYYIFFAPLVASLCSVFSIQNDDSYYYLHCYMFGNMITTSNNYYKDFLLLFFLTIENYMQFFLPNLVTVLIFFLCQYLSDIINTFVARCSAENWQEYCLVHGETKTYKILEVYKKIKKNFDVLNELSSWPIFLIISQKFLTLFFTLTVILSSKKKKILIQLIEACFLAFNAVASLVLLIVAGSRIQETHGKIRSLLFGMIEFREHQHVPLRYEILPLLKTFVEKEDMIMTAAGMIPVTRSLFLKIGAALVTYGVLIVQLDTSDDP